MSTETFRLLAIDGDTVTLTAAEFLADNEDMGDIISGLTVGATYHGGGGAACEWSITRIA